MGDKGSTRSHKVDHSNKSGASSTALNSSRDYSSDDKNESLLYGKISKKSIKQASRGLINNSLNDDDQTLSSVEQLDVQIDMSALDPDKNPEGYE
jgi:hypothetical protein